MKTLKEIWNKLTSSSSTSSTTTHTEMESTTTSTTTTKRDDTALMNEVIERAEKDVEKQRRTLQIYHAQRVAEGIQSEPKRNG